MACCSDPSEVCHTSHFKSLSQFPLKTAVLSALYICHDHRLSYINGRIARFIKIWEFGAGKNPSVKIGRKDFNCFFSFYLQNF